MYHFVMFDLPVLTKYQRSKATKFRTFLLQEGYTMIQNSVYVKIYKGAEVKNKLERKIKQATPEEGNVKCLPITEMQFKDMNTIVSPKRRKKESVLDKQYTMMF